MKICKINKILCSFVILACITMNFLYFADNVNNLNEISHNQENKTTKDIILNEIALSSSLNENYSNIFNFSEYTNRIYDWSPIQNGDITIECPITYNFTKSIIDFKVMNATVNETIVEDAFNSESDYEQAQSFFLYEDSYLENLSIYTGGTKDYAVNIEIRNNTYDGTTIHSQIVNLNVDGWFNISFAEKLLLKAGKYFLYMDSNPTPSNYGWFKDIGGVSNNDTETWVFTGSNWVSIDFDLTLKVYSYPTLNPEDVEMTVNNINVTNQEQGIGFVEVNSTILGSNIILNIEANSTIKYSFYANTSYFRYTNPIINYTFINDVPYWELKPLLDNPGDPYSDYYVNLTGIMADYYDLQVFQNLMVISYEFIGDNIIKFEKEANKITFKSPNYISTFQTQDSAISGEIVPINMEVLDHGNISVLIKDIDEKIIYNSWKLDNNSVDFQWNVGTSIKSGIYEILVNFSGRNEIGRIRTEISILNRTKLISYNIEANVLDIIELECTYLDEYLDEIIEDASVYFSTSYISGELDYSELDDGNYTYNLNLDTYSLLSGTHNVILNATAPGYQSQDALIQLELNKRNVSTSIITTASKINIGETLKIAISLTDFVSGKSLKRPANITVKIVSSIGSSNENIIYGEELSELSQYGEIEWIIPDNIDLGKYNIIIEVESDFYQGIYIQEDFLDVIPQSNWWIYLILSLGIILSGLSFYIQRNKSISRHSIWGMIILHENGIPVAQELSSLFSNTDPVLISGALTGILSLIKEITGKGIRVIEIDGGYMNIVRRSHYWLATFMKNNPNWIRKDIQNCVNYIEKNYGDKIDSWDGFVLKIPLIDIIREYFGNTLLEDNER